MRKKPPTVANDQHPIQPVPGVAPGSNSILIAATLDGYVTLRTAGGDSKLDPVDAERGAADMREAARVARHIRTLTSQAPKGLDEQGMIDFITKAFETTPMED